MNLLLQGKCYVIMILQSHWSLPLFGNRPQKCHQTISLQEAQASWHKTKYMYALSLWEAYTCAQYKRVPSSHNCESNKTVGVNPGLSVLIRLGHIFTLTLLFRIQGGVEQSWIWQDCQIKIIFSNKGSKQPLGAARGAVCVTIIHQLRLQLS